jgi:LPPG:FO 2-phospho-L-lactate transferase
MITVLAGGVGAARFLEGVITVLPQEQVTVISNTGDDLDFCGLRVCPDIDIVIYTLAATVDHARGWGLLHDTFHVVEGLRRFQPDVWFNLGDHDLATSLYRTQRLAEGATLTKVTAEITTAHGLGLRVLPMSDARVATRIQTPEGELAFQEYFVRRGTADEVTGVRFAGVEAAAPAPGVIEAIRGAEAVVIAPSNPFVSIGPILSVRGVREALKTAARVVAVSPIVGGEAIKGPAAKMLRSLGHAVSATEVARLYGDFLDTLVLDQVDAALAPEVEAAGVRAVVTDTIMRGRREKASLAAVTLATVELKSAGPDSSGTRRGRANTSA